MVCIEKSVCGPVIAKHQASKAHDLVVGAFVVQRHALEEVDIVGYFENLVFLLWLQLTATAVPVLDEISPPQ